MFKTELEVEFGQRLGYGTNAVSILVMVRFLNLQKKNKLHKDVFFLKKHLLIDELDIHSVY